MQKTIHKFSMYDAYINAKVLDVLSLAEMWLWKFILLSAWLDWKTSRRFIKHISGCPWRDFQIWLDHKSPDVRKTLTFWRIYNIAAFLGRW